MFDSAGCAGSARTRPADDEQINRLHADGFFELAMFRFVGPGILDVRLIENSKHSVDKERNPIVRMPDVCLFYFLEKYLNCLFSEDMFIGQE